VNLAAEVAAIIDAAIAREVFPGAVVLLQRADRVLHHAAYGTTMYDHSGTQPVRPDTIYDIASLTKVFTASAVLRLVERGLIELDAPACRYLPELSARTVTITQLLTHTSGLDLRLSALRAGGPAGVHAAALAAPLRHPPGSTVAYSNINTLLLGLVVERVTGHGLDAAIAHMVCTPLGLEQTRFCPPAAWRAAIPPTEYDHDWRGGLVQGVVHDESTYAIGGIAGHAGMFSTATDLARFCAAWRAAVAGDPHWLSPALAQRAVTNHAPAHQPGCGLGWMLDRPNVMGAVPPGCYGHTGFTGPVMVVVPAADLTLVILSNRTFPQRTPPTHHQVTVALLAAALLA
jgi:serine-type D-Ala-D-Ala carboxypeptidase